MTKKEPIHEDLKILAEGAAQFQKVIDSIGKGRETAIATMKLDEAVMWCSQAILHKDMRKELEKEEGKD
jgi:hypothetical protein